MLRITESHTKYRKREKNVQDVDTVNKHIAGLRLPSLGTDDEIPTTSENVKTHALKENHSHILSLPHKYEHQ